MERTNNERGVGGWDNKFIKTIRKVGDSLGFTIPHEVVTVEGYEEGDIIEIWVKKIPKKEE